MLAIVFACVPSNASEINDPPPVSLCQSNEVVLALCPTHSKTASVCGVAPGRAIYRFGRAGRIEKISRNLNFANQMFSSGGETQIAAVSVAYRYVIFNRIVRTGFGKDGHADQKFSSGLFVQRNGRKIASMACLNASEVIISNEHSRYMPEGKFVSH